MKLIGWLSDSNDNNRIIAEAKKNKIISNQYRDSWPVLKVYLLKSIRVFLERLKT